MGLNEKTLAHGVRTLLRRILTGGCLLYALWCAKAIGQEVSPTTLRSLHDAALAYFAIGVGISDRISERPADWPLLTSQFRAVTPENCLKPKPVQVVEGQFNFRRADAFVDFSVSNGLQVVGHCLVWAKDDRTPPWFYRDGTNIATRTLLLERMKTHIATVVGRYRGRIATWDVVNEALDDGTNYLRPSGWTAACGEEFIAKAFEFAHAADPQALLIYNDYNNELPAKRAKLIRLVRSLREQAAPVHAIGLQGHYEIDRLPLADIEATLMAMRELGVRVVISKLDRRHADVIARISFWNLHDGQSWLNGFPWKRVNHPLLFDRQGKPKPAFDAVISVLKEP